LLVADWLIFDARNARPLSLRAQLARRGM